MEPGTYQQPPVRKSVLIVDGDPQSLRIVDVSLRRAGFEVRAATDGATALQLIQREPPDLVLADTDLPELDGFELCRRVKMQPGGGNLPFVFLARPTKASRLRGIEVGADDFLSKPVYVKEVVSRVSVLLQRSTRARLSLADAGGDRVTGKLSDLSMLDLLQTIAANGRSGVVHVNSAGGARGEVYFRKGSVVDAEVGRLSGSDAIYRLFSWADGTYEIEWRNIRRRDTVALAAPALLMEGMRRLDEWTRMLHDLPPLETVFEVDYRLLAERLADIPDEVNGILRLFDGVRTFLQVIDDCGLPDLDAVTIIGKLHAEAIVRDAKSRPATEETSGPELDGWLTDPAAPFGTSADAVTRGDRRTSRPPDKTEIHRRPTAPDEPPPEAVAGELSGRFADRLHAEGESAPSHESTRGMSPEEPAVVIPFPTATPSVRQTLVSPSGGPASAPAVAGELTATAAPTSTSSASPPPLAPSASMVSVPRATDPGLGVAPGLGAAAPGPGVSAPGPGVSNPRSTDPGIGPVVSASPPPSSSAHPAHAAPAVASAGGTPSGERTVATDEPAPAGRASSSRVPALPFSDSASRWMTEGDEIHSDRTRADAIEELNLPSRFRGLIVVGVAAIVAVAAIFIVRGVRSNPPAEPAPTVAVAPPRPLPPPPLVPNSKIEPAVPAPAAPVAAGANPAAPAPPQPAAAPAPAAAEPAGGPSAPVGEAPEFEKLLGACQEAFTGGRIKDAVTICSAAKDADPSSAKALSLLSHVEFNRNHRKDALTWAEKAIQIDPKLADAYVIIGGVQQEAGRNGEAKAAYKKYLDLAPKGQYASDLRSILETL